MQLVSLLADDKLGKLREDTSVPLNARYEELFAAIDSDPNNQLVVAVDRERVMGMMQLTFIPYLTHTGTWRCLIEGVRISSENRGSGLGSRMIEWAITRARERGCGLVQLTTDKQRPDAIRFYQGLGFVASHEGFKLKLDS